MSKKQSEEKNMILYLNKFNKEINITKSVFDKFDLNKSEYLQIDEKNPNKLVVLDSFFGEDKIVKDVCRYILEKKDCKWQIKAHNENHPDFHSLNFNDQHLNYKDGIPCIILLLESPHKNEYTVNDFKPIAPAQKSTGTKIKNWLNEIIKINCQIFKLEKNKYKVILLNPVPYQTSLHYLLTDQKNKLISTIRDDTWKTIWEQEFKQNFNKKIKALNPVLILNACTKELQPFVQYELCKHFSNEKNNIDSYLISHPSSWSEQKFKDKKPYHV